MAVSTIPPSKLVVGLETVRASDSKPYTAAQLEERFALINKLGVRKLALWKSPIPDNWIPFLDAWVNYDSALPGESESPLV